MKMYANFRNVGICVFLRSVIQPPASSFSSSGFLGSGMIVSSIQFQVPSSLPFFIIEHGVLDVFAVLSPVAIAKRADEEENAARQKKEEEQVRQKDAGINVVSMHARFSLLFVVVIGTPVLGAAECLDIGHQRGEVVGIVHDPGERRHHGTLHEVSWIAEMGVMPLRVVLAADAREVGTSAFRAEHVR